MISESTLQSIRAAYEVGKLAHAKVMQSTPLSPVGESSLSLATRAMDYSAIIPPLFSTGLEGAETECLRRARAAVNLARMAGRRCAAWANFVAMTEEALLTLARRAPAEDEALSEAMDAALAALQRVVELSPADEAGKGDGILPSPTTLTTDLFLLHMKLRLK